METVAIINSWGIRSHKHLSSRDTPCPESDGEAKEAGEGILGSSEPPSPSQCLLHLFFTSRSRASLREEATATGEASGQNSLRTTQDLFKTLVGAPAFRLPLLQIATTLLLTLL